MLSRRQPEAPFQPISTLNRAGRTIPESLLSQCSLINPHPDEIAPAFGFSAGDFIAATKLIVDVSKALKDAGGASDEYRSLVAEFDLLQNPRGAAVILELGDTPKWAHGRLHET